MKRVSQRRIPHRIGTILGNNRRLSNRSLTRTRRVTQKDLDVRIRCRLFAKHVAILGDQIAALGNRDGERNFAVLALGASIVGNRHGGDGGGQE